VAQREERNLLLSRKSGGSSVDTGTSEGENTSFFREDGVVVGGVGELFNIGGDVSLNTLDDNVHGIGPDEIVCPQDFIVVGNKGSKLRKPSLGRQGKSA